MEDDQVIGCTILYRLPGEATKVQLMQMAVDEVNQGKGIGKQIIAFAKKLCVQHGISEITCHARDTARRFYENVGFEIYGEPFEEAGIAHHHMRWRVN